MVTSHPGQLTSGAFRHAIATLDGGFAAVIRSTNSAAAVLVKSDSTGLPVWSQSFENGWAFDLLEEETGDLLFLSSDAGEVVQVGQRGTILKKMVLEPGLVGIRYTRIARYADGYLIGGTRFIPGAGPECDYFYFTGFSKDLTVGSTIQVAAGRSGCDLPEIMVIKQLPGGGFVFSPRPEGVSVYRIINAGPTGTVRWDVSIHGTKSSVVSSPSDQPNSLNAPLSDMLRTQDGGFVLAGSSDQTTGYARQAANFGFRDVWLVKIDADGNYQWDRSYGGSADDDLDSIVPTGDGGFLLAGYSDSEAPSGNKMTAGKGYWIVKVDSRGLKQSEVLIPTPASQTIRIGTGFKVIGNQQSSDGSSNVWSSDLSVLTRVVVSAASAPGAAFSIETSDDLQVWTGLLTGFSGSIDVRENTDLSHKFWRVLR